MCQCGGPGHFLGGMGPSSLATLCGLSSSQGEPQSWATIHQFVTQACESAIQSEWPSLIEDPKPPVPHVSLSPHRPSWTEPAPNLSKPSLAWPFSLSRTVESWGGKGLFPAPTPC